MAEFHPFPLEPIDRISFLGLVVWPKVIFVVLVRAVQSAQKQSGVEGLRFVEIPVAHIQQVVDVIVDYRVHRLVSFPI